MSNKPDKQHAYVSIELVLWDSKLENILLLKNEHNNIKKLSLPKYELYFDLEKLTSEDIIGLVIKEMDNNMFCGGCYFYINGIMKSPKSPRYWVKAKFLNGSYYYYAEKFMIYPQGINFTPLWMKPNSILSVLLDDEDYKEEFKIFSHIENFNINEKLKLFIPRNKDYIKGDNNKEDNKKDEINFLTNNLETRNNFGSVGIIIHEEIDNVNSRIALIRDVKSDKYYLPSQDTDLTNETELSVERILGMSYKMLYDLAIINSRINTEEIMKRDNETWVTIDYIGDIMFERKLISNKYELLWLKLGTALILLPYNHKLIILSIVRKHNENLCESLCTFLNKAWLTKELFFRYYSHEYYGDMSIQ